MKNKHIVKVCAIAVALGMVSPGYAAMALQEAQSGVHTKKAEVAPDLLIQSIRLLPKPKEGETIGRPARFEILLKNSAKGMAHKGTLELRCTIKNSSTRQCPKELSGVLNFSDLSGGESLRLTWPTRARSQWIAGDYTLSAEIDPQNSIAESNEKNNRKTFRFGIEKPHTPARKDGTSKDTHTKATSAKEGRERDASAVVSAKPAQESAEQKSKKSDLRVASPVTLGPSAVSAGKAARVLAHPSADACRDYAADAVAKATTAQRNGCGFEGDRWGLDETKHYEWCLSVNADARQLESDARQAGMGECSECKSYAKEAADSAVQAQNNMCGFQGSGWQNDSKEHFKWCKAADPSQRMKERENRMAALQKCGEVTRIETPRYLGMLVDFCMYRRTETHTSTPIEGELYDYDFGWMCGVDAVADSYCISQGYEAMVDFKVADAKASQDTLPLGNAHKCDAAIPLSNCRGFDFIRCRKPLSGSAPVQLGTQLQTGAAKMKEAKALPQPLNAICQAYAKEAIGQYHQANSSWCTLGYAFDPAVWHGDATVHHAWCLNATADQRRSESDKRKARLQECAKTERVRFEQPAVNGVRVDTFLYARKPHQGEPDVPQRAADAFCQRMGYEKAVREWFLYNTTYEAESIDHTIHMTDGPDINNDLDECDLSWSLPSDKCEAFNHITCERAKAP